MEGVHQTLIPTLPEDSTGVKTGSSSFWAKIMNFVSLCCCCCSFIFGVLKNKFKQEDTTSVHDQQICCCCGILTTVGQFFKRCFTKKDGSSTNNKGKKVVGPKEGFTKKDGSSTNNKGKKVVGPKEGPLITDDSFILLIGLETPSNKLYLEHKALREEVDEHIKEVAVKFGMIMAVATTGSLGVGAVTCGVALEMAILYFTFLWIILTFVLIIGWNRISGCHSRLQAKIDEQDELIVRLDEMKNAFKKSDQFQPSTSSESNNHEKVREFHRRLRAAIGTTRADIRDCLCLTYVLVALLNVAGYMHCALMSFILYKGVCPGEKKAPVPSPHIL